MEYVLNSPRLDPMTINLPFINAELILSSVFGLNKVSDWIQIEFTTASGNRRRKQKELEELRATKNDPEARLDWTYSEWELLTEYEDSLLNESKAENNRLQIARVSEPLAWLRFLDYDLNFPDGKAINTLRDSAAVVQNDLLPLLQNDRGNCSEGGKACYEENHLGNIESSIKSLSMLMIEFSGLQGWLAWYGYDADPNPLEPNRSHQPGFVSFLDGLTGTIIALFTKERRSKYTELKLYRERVEALMDKIMALVY